MYISLLSVRVVEACVVVGVPGHVGESGLPPTRRRPSISGLIRILAQGLDSDAPAAVKVVHRVLK